MIIGLTGKNGSGKTAVSDYLKSRGFEYHSLSDEIREEIRRRGLEITREVLIDVGNELREKFGPGVLAERVLRNLGTGYNYVVDSIRNPYEVEVLRSRSDFTMLAVEADQSVRFERSIKRGRENAARTLEQFIREEKRELDSDNPANQQLHATREKADLVIANDGTLEELHRKLDQMLPPLMSRFMRPTWDEYFMSIAKVVAMRSNCMKRKVAAIIVKDMRVVSTGYNGTPEEQKTATKAAVLGAMAWLKAERH
jgi:dCMP deaminase